MRVNSVCGICVGAALLCSTALQVQAAPADELLEVYLDLQENSGGRSTLTAISEAFRDVDSNQNGIEKAELDFHDARFRAQYSSNHVAQWLRFDINQDAKVSEEELTLFLSFESARRERENEQMKRRAAQQLRTLVVQAMEADADHNGVVEGVELYAPRLPRSARTQEQLDRNNPVRFAKALYAADPNGDGLLTEIEAAGLIGTVLKDADALVEKRRNEREERRAYGIGDHCKPYDVPKTGALIALSAREGRAIPTVTVSGQDDETTAAVLDVERGSKPLTLILHHQTPMIWHITGAVERVVRIVAIGPLSPKFPGKIQSGIVGVAAERIEFVANQGCIRGFTPDRTKDIVKVGAALAKLAGRNLDAVLSANAVMTASLPSGKGLQREEPQDLAGPVAAGDKRIFTLNTQGQIELVGDVSGHDMLQRSFLDSMPGGILQFKPTDVVTGNAAESYEVLPKQAGLIQLRAAGQIESTNDGYWKIKGKFRFPAGLNREFSTKFLLPKGAPEPVGNPGQSCVHSEDPSFVQLQPTC